MDEVKNEQGGTPAPEGGTPKETDQFDAKAEIESLKENFDTQIKERDEKINALEGRLARETKKEKKAEAKTEAPKQDNTELLTRLDNLALKAEGIKEQDEVDLAKKLKEETGKEMDELLMTKYFQSELQSLRDDKSNRAATEEVKGSGSAKNANTDPKHYEKLGRPPTAEEIPDKKERIAVMRKMFPSNQGNKLKFWNEE